ncbi:GNAT family N-acetyltransferase [Rummeliibacillus pycnus]|uniref:GNAT family N-acetyltransferase n=1 Tax=Rummeliibacillus pycnus TaxID=101070 RepID=UPI003D26C308
MGQIKIKQYTMKNGEKITLTTALPEYAERVLNFNKDIISEAPYLVTTREEFKISIEQEEKFLQQVFEDNGKLAIIAEFQGEVIGFLDFHNGHRNRIKHQGSFGMSVSKQFRNQGIGSALLTELLNWAEQEASIEKVCLEVVSINKSAIHMYENFGFIVEGKKLKAIKNENDTYYDLLLMAYFTQ